MKLGSILQLLDGTNRPVANFYPHENQNIAGTMKPRKGLAKVP
jgi:hypothetical protein